jgi:ABC-2 type transport system ATP-binding protein
VKVYDKKVEAVKGVDLIVHEKQIIGLLGPNGAGKSSTFNMITMQT